MLLNLQSSRSLYTDGEVDKFIQQFPSLADPYDNRSPDNVLQILKIDTAVLEETDRYVGDCLCFIA